MTSTPPLSREQGTGTRAILPTEVAVPRLDQVTATVRDWWETTWAAPAKGRAQSRGRRGFSAQVVSAQSRW